VKEYDLYLPLYYNDGTRVPAKLIQQLKTRLLEQFGGLTFFPQPNEGLWKMANVTYRDKVVIFRINSSQTRTARRFFTGLKAQLKLALK
jgi:hypothetical protein